MPRRPLALSQVKMLLPVPVVDVIVVADDMAKVIDFGIAKFRDWGDTRSRTSGAKVGTLLYMAPEQLDEGLGVPIDERTDRKSTRLNSSHT